MRIFVVTETRLEETTMYTIGAFSQNLGVFDSLEEAEKCIEHEVSKLVKRAKKRNRKYKVEVYADGRVVTTSTRTYQCKDAIAVEEVELQLYQKGGNKNEI